MTSFKLIGSVKSFIEEKNYGFVTVDGEDHFFRRQILEAAGFKAKDAVIGAVVEFVPETVNGKKRVREIVRIGLELARQPEPKQKTTTTLREISVGERYCGEVLKYDEDRGFGFIKVEGMSPNVFFHITNMVTDDLPQVGGRYHFTAVQGSKSIAAELIFTADNVTAGEYVRLCEKYEGMGDQAIPKSKPATNDTLQRTVVDKNEDGDQLIKVSRYGRLIHFEVKRTNDSSTHVLTGVRTLTEARKRIGKVLPKIVTESQPTNDPTLSQSMKGANGGSKKKAA